MYNRFRLLYKPGDPTGDKEVIIVGFSRGAAQARAFANRVYDEASARGEEIPQIQFLGLFDTVRMCPGLKQAIPRNVRYAAHATARNENRRAFPLTVLFPRDPESDVTCVSREFYGAHSDIGGGYKDNWISNAVLFWMWNQMQDAGITTVNRPDPQVAADWQQYLKCEETIFRWHEFLDRHQPGYSRQPPWHDSSTWWPWFFDRVFPRSARRIIGE